MRSTWQTTAWFLAFAAIGCSDGDAISTSESSEPSTSALVKAADCRDAQQRFRAQALDRMNAQLDRAVEQAYRLLSPAACPRTTPSGPSASGASPSGSAQGASAPSSSSPIPPPSASSVSTQPSPAAPAAGAPSGASQAPASTTPAVATAPPSANAASAAADAHGAMATATSTTNNQVAAVDEADFIKNDAKYVYAALNGAFRILTAWPPEQAAELAKLPLEGTVRKLFVSGDRALVYVSIPTSSVARPSTSWQQPPPPAASYAARTECTYGYDCDFGGDGTSTVMLVFDIADRSQPRLLRRLELRGSLIAARRIDNAVHTVVVTPEIVFPGLSFSLPGVAACDPWLTREQIDAQADAVRIRNTRIIEQTDIQLVPSVVENGQDYAANACTATYFDRSASGSAFTSLVSLALDSDAPPSITTIVSKAGAVYASEQSLYMAVPGTTQAGLLPVAASDTTPAQYQSTLHKFAIGSALGQSSYLASGTVQGHVLNQFSMDEHDGYLRVATTSGKVPAASVYSTLSVLAPDALGLHVVGAVEHIAPGEDIRAVRFDGQHGFVVTFKKTDPLYMFDLSRPEAPRITGELQIPGFSTYLHMLDDTHLLAIGYDADDQGTFAFFSGVLLQIFDVSTPSAPALLHKTVIGTRGSSSEALTNHLAFNLFQDKLAVPMTICEGGTPGSFGTNLTFSGLIVYDVSLERGIVERGRVAHPNLGDGYDNASCRNWWTHAGSTVQRSVFMDDYVYSIAPDILRVQRLSAMGTDVASVRLAP